MFNNKLTKMKMQKLRIMTFTGILTIALASSGVLGKANGILLHGGGIEEVLNAYMDIKDALVKDDTKEAARAGKTLAEAATEFDVSDFANSEIKEILEVIKEHGEHIAKSEIEHQREHFAELAQELKDLVKITGTDRTLYTQFCPMYDNKQGGYWLSTSEEIMNPLLGSKMPKCGIVKEVTEKN